MHNRILSHEAAMRQVFFDRHDQFHTMVSQNGINTRIGYTIFIAEFQQLKEIFDKCGEQKLSAWAQQLIEESVALRNIIESREIANDRERRAAVPVDNPHVAQAVSTICS